MDISDFHPLVARWFTDTFGAPDARAVGGVWGDRRGPGHAH